jgi:D-methionine transport system ATP-binding protein
MRAAESESAVVMRGVVREVGDESAPGARVRLLDGIDLDVARGRLLHVVGPSGAGKSTLVRLINRLDDATQGSVEVLGRPVADWPVRQLRRQVAMAFQEASLLGLTVRENLRLPFVLSGGTPGDLEPRIAATLALAGLDAAWLDRDASRLSVGQKQRVALARAMIGEPQILLLDEPTSGLDPRTAEQLLDSVESIRERSGLTVIMVTHRLEEARRVGGDLAVLIAGRIEALGEVDAVIEQTENGRVREFLTGDPDATG